MEPLPQALAHVVAIEAEGLPQDDSDDRGEGLTETSGLCESVMTQYLFQRSSSSLASLDDLKCEISRG